MAEAAERLIQRRDQLLAPSRKGAVVRWPPPATIPLTWEEQEDQSLRPELKAVTEAVVIPYQPQFIPIAKGESGGIVEDFAADIAAPSGRLFYAAKKHFYYHRLAEIEGERAAEARRRQLEMQEAAEAEDAVETITPTRDHPKSPGGVNTEERMPSSVGGVASCAATPKHANDRCELCNCMRVLCLCDMTRVGGRNHHRVCKMHGLKRNP